MTAMLTLALALFALVPQDPAAKGTSPVPIGLPKVPDGFTAELVLAHPDIRWPSAVHCPWDDALLVAEDPMDMPGPTDQPLDRIWLLQFRPDGSFTKTLFAEQLFAVMGMQEIDGAIYVMNMPHLTVLRDADHDGVAESRVELLTDLGPVAPGWPGGFNDHIVSGLRLGMDGFLYVSVGDKGVPLAHGTDGSSITLRGGGCVRVRPDGSRLEIVASGTRNHLDVAMNESDEIFTFDNTDDGLGWWTRLSHLMPTGYYGYPWDYHDHPERMLPCMKDDGGGSGVGALIYREDAWPEEYRGDWFACDWADRAVRRYKVERTGASYRCTLSEDFVSPGESGEFRPLDIAESADGRCLYIADWNYPGWTNPTEAGRVWRIRRTEDKAGERPLGGLADFTPATLVQASAAQLIANLDHPAFRRRLAVQRELSHRDPCQIPELLDVVAHGTTDRARRHALWAFGDGGLCCAHDLQRKSTPLDSTSADTRANGARAAGSRGPASDAVRAKLAELVVKDPDLVVRREAAIALGRIGDASAVWPLVQALDAPGLGDDLFVRFAIRQALRALPCKWDVLVPKFLPKASPRAQDDLWQALRELYDVKLAMELALATKNPAWSTAQRVAALETLASIHRKRAPWDGKWWQTQPAKNPPPPKTEAWEATDFIVKTLARAFDDPAPEMRAAALATVAETREPELFARVRARLADAATLTLLAQLGDVESAPLCVANLTASDEALRAAAASALFQLKGAESLPALRPLLNDNAAAVRDAALLAWTSQPDATLLADYLRGLALEPTLASACRNALATLREPIRPTLEALARDGKLDAITLSIAREIYDQPQPIVRWKLYGPFPRATHVAELEAGREGEPVKIVDGAAPHGFVDLKKALADQAEVCAYAVAWYDSPDSRNARCSLGSDDGVTLWVNGAKVHENLGDRGWAPDQDRIEIDLRAGTNVLLLRVEQAAGDWSFNLKVSEPGSGPLYNCTTPVALLDPQLYREFASANRGDAARGEKVFRDEKGPGCFKCHAIAGVGPKVGPDLRDVGTKYPRAELVTSILEPSQRILDGFAATNVFLTNGDVESGLIVGEKDGALALAGADGAIRSIPLAQVKERRAAKLSAMPAGVHERLTLQQFADLVAWLETLRL